MEGGERQGGDQQRTGRHRDRGETAGVTDKEDTDTVGRQRERQARKRRQLRAGGAENKLRENQAREAEAKKVYTITASHPTHLGARSPESQWKSLPASPQRPVPSTAPCLSRPRLTPSLPPAPHSPDLPTPRRPRMAKLTSRGALCCCPLPARGFPNTEDMATLRRGRRVLA